MDGDHQTINQHFLPKPVSARYLRFHPVTWIDRPCLRVEIYRIRSECQPHVLNLIEIEICLLAQVVIATSWYLSLISSCRVDDITGLKGKRRLDPSKASLIWRKLVLRTRVTHLPDLPRLSQLPCRSLTKLAEPFT